MATTFAPAAGPAWFRIAAILALFWNAFGAVMCLSALGVFGDPITGLTEPQRAAALAIPAGIIAAFALGTFTGVIGSLGLLLARRWAFRVLIVSAAALLVLEGWILFLSGDADVHGIAIPVAVSLVAILLVLLASTASNRGWLR
jgi:hypothetical protein